MKQFQELGYEQLHAELKKMINQAQRMTVWFNQDKQIRLLPALAAMKSLVAQPGRRFKAGEPDWEEECRLLGISAEQVRQWKHRTASEKDIRHLLGEEPTPRHPASVAPTVEFHRLMMLTKAIIEGDEIKAEKLAHAFAEEYGI
jgi:hypothetical protein